MRFTRREALLGGAASVAAATLPFAAESAVFDPKPGAWRSFAVTTRLEILQPQGATRAWVPLPSFEAADWMKPVSNDWQANTDKVVRVTDPVYGAAMVAASWEAGAAPTIEVTSRIMTRDRAVDLARPGQVAPLSAVERALYTRATDLLPTDGIVKATADRIVAGKRTDLAKAQAIYDWVVDNTFRNAKTRGCGLGDIASMLKTADLGGKCADLNALFVGLARAAGLPARDIYGIRVAPSKFGYKSLGAGSEVITKAQHCRAEVFLDGFGWVPADPADVRKVVLEEPPGNLAVTDAKVLAARRALFGAWETNWLAYNVAHDVKLPGSKGEPIGFLMYPQAETEAGLLDCLEPDAMRYTITAREVAA
jgi:transglutaminase-like putative cysteine protease